MELYPVYDRKTDNFLYHDPANNPEEVYTKIRKKLIEGNKETKLIKGVITIQRIKDKLYINGYDDPTTLKYNF